MNTNKLIIIAVGLLVISTISFIDSLGILNDAWCNAEKYQSTFCRMVKGEHK